jgi:hypothetical protein
MTRYTCDPALELNGHFAAALIRSINRENYMPVLKQLLRRQRQHLFREDAANQGG